MNAGPGGGLRAVQCRLLDIGSVVATPVSSASPAALQRVQWDPQHTIDLERWIDALDARLPRLTSFVLPSGGLAAAHLHVARTFARQAERSCVALLANDQHRQQQPETGNLNNDASQQKVREEEEGAAVAEFDPEVVVYLNRLSDLLFVAARFAAQHAGATEFPYKKK